MVRLIGSNAVNCMTLIPLLASGPLVIFIAALKSGAPAHPDERCMGAWCGTLAAVFYAMNCFDDSPLFVITWYPLALLAVVSTGYFAGLCFLRW